jgi:hypothetical protein
MSLEHLFEAPVVKWMHLINCSSLECALQNDWDKHWCHILRLKCGKKAFGLLVEDNRN